MEKKLPKFFKVLIPGFRKKLRLPPVISKKLGRKEAAKRVTLISRRGRSQVKIHRGKNGLLSFGRRGWKQFVDEHSLMVGDLLVFKHAGVGSLDVKVSIFDPTCCEKDCRRRLPTADPQTFSNGDRENDFNTKHVKLERRNGNVVKNKKLGSEKRDTKNAERQNGFNTNHVKVEERGTGNAVKYQKLDDEKYDNERTSAARVKKRKVSITVKPYHIRKAGAYLPIPRSFCLANGIHKSQVVTLKGPSGVEHRARLVVYKSCAQISRGWLEFTESNNLNVGDTCVFKLRRRRVESSSDGIVFGVKVSCAVN